MKRFALVSFSALCLVAVSAAGALAGEWHLLMVPLDEGDWAAIKYHEETGECYRAASGNWVPCGEEGSDVPDGEYEVVVIPAGADWNAIRMNTETGQSWRLTGGNWIDMEQEGGGGDSSSSRPAK